MPFIGIQGSLCSGHGGFPPRPALSGAPLVTINGIPALVNGNPFAVHSDGDSAHGGVAISSRPWCTINGIGVVCTGDLVSCGSVVITGDPLVTIS
ncbi:PAAR domain-containing protein [Escherichia coli]|uniref:PAAR domain-containing protein n=1 Tax=Escherichia coli TaxID=562 RepID=UPI0027DFF597|nr:PAAR domain-containing protein [Escherichia coli]